MISSLFTFIAVIIAAIASSCSAGFQTVSVIMISPAATESSVFIPSSPFRNSTSMHFLHTTWHFYTRYTWTLQ